MGYRSTILLHYYYCRSRVGIIMYLFSFFIMFAVFGIGKEAE